MDRILEYPILEAVYDSKTSAVYRAVRESDQSPVIIKTLKQNHPSPKDILRYKHEFRITAALGKLPCVNPVYGFIKNNNAISIVFADIGGQSLDNLLRSGSLSSETALTIAIKICEALGEIHSENILHRDLNPSNIVVNQTTGQLRIIDFGSACYFSDYSQSSQFNEPEENSLSYIAPEQTGRINRPVDYRSDYYSFGVTLYELFTGRLPFETHDPLELVHSHVARKPTAPHETRSDVSQSLSVLILKLLAKAAENRYQSSFGIKADLEFCLRELISEEPNRPFKPGLLDIPERFVIAQHLYGRDRELRDLSRSFETVAAGGKRFTLVTGHAGVGKTSLVDQLHKNPTIRKGYFISGKFDQLHGTVPHEAVIAPFKNLIKQILTESQDSLTKWKQMLLGALGANCRVMIDVIPEIELITGPLPVVPELAPLEAQNRFRRVFQEFIRIFCSPENPLLIFLDDLQWADLSSLKMLELIMTDPETKYLHVIASYRDEEIDSSHPLLITLEAIQKLGVMPEAIKLEPLGFGETCSLISDTLGRRAETVFNLGELVSQKTGGNPFFLKAFLRSLYQDELLNYNTSRGCWEWNLDDIRKQNITDNVASLMMSRIQRLPAFCQELLAYAACLGAEFGTNILSEALATPQRDVVEALGAAVSEGIIFPLGDDQKWSDQGLPDNPEIVGHSFKFSHDKIQAAALSTITEENRRAIHERLGQTLLEKTPQNEIETILFDVVNQLNRAVANTHDDHFNSELAEMNLRAGRKAKLSSAFEVASDYFRTGLSLVGESGWKKDYDLTLNLHIELLESAYLLNRFDQMQELADTVCQNALSLVDKVKVYEVQIRAFIAQNKRVDAVRTALPILALLHVTFSEKPTKARIITDLLKTKLLLISGQNVFSRLSGMTDIDKLAAMRIMASVLPAAYTVTPNLFPVIIFKMVRLTVKYGIAQQSALAFSAYGLILCSGIGDVKSGYRYGEMALGHLTGNNIKEDFCRVSFVFNSFIRIRREALRSGLQPLRDGYHSGIEVGDLEYAALSGAFYCTQGFAAGKELQELERELGIFSKAISKLNQQTTHYLALLYHQCVLNLIGDSDNPLRLVGKEFDEDAILPSMFEKNERAIILATHIHKLILAYLFGNYNESLKYAEIVEQYLDGAQGTVLIPLAAFYGSLVRLALIDGASPNVQKKYFKKISNNQLLLEKWSRDAPMNYLHKYHLVKAEICRTRGQTHKAMDHYQIAIDLARENEFLNEEALALEKTASFYESVGKTINARAFYEEARYCYLRWGALAKVRHLEQAHSKLLGTNYEKPLETASDWESMHTNGTRSLDVAAVLKASQALSGEIVLKDLLTRLMSLVIEIAGAEKGFLIIPENDHMLVCAMADTASSTHFLDQPLPVEQTKGLSVSIVNYVARVKESIIIHDAKTDSAFSNDIYVQEFGPRSICCVPVMRSGRLSALLYIENNETTGAFTEKRAEMLRVISAQAAISIENAMLYRAVDQSATRYKSLIENAQEMILIIQDGKIKFFNPKTCGLTGYSSEDLAVSSVANFVHPDDLQIVADRDAKAISSGMVPPLITFRIVRKDGGHIWVQVNSVVINWENNPATLNFLTDITEIKAATDISMRTERLRAVGELAAGVAHNFNNLLQVIMSGVELALVELESGNSSRIRNRLELIRESSRFGSETVKRLQSFAQIRAQDTSHDRKIFDLSELARQAAEISAPWWKTNLEKEGLRVEMKLDLSAGCTVSGKESEIFEVLINLIKNSAEAMPRGGSISIKTFLKEDVVHLELSDTGTGIAEEHLERLFEPFFSTKGVAGTGLGLAVSHGILCSHGGLITVKSKKNFGTTFSITLPLARYAETRAETTYSGLNDLSLRILIIDDSAPSLMLMDDLLTVHNQTVLSAESGPKGLELYHDNKVDLIICDLGMPELSGWEVGRMVKKCCLEKGCSKTPFILLTGWGGQSFDADRVTESGIDAVLEKPIDTKSLFLMIRKFGFAH